MSKTVTLWIDNKVDQPKEFTYDEIIQAMCDDEHAIESYNLGLPFDRIILSVMSKLGSFDMLTDGQWDGLYKAKRKKGL